MSQSKKVVLDSIQSKKGIKDLEKLDYLIKKDSVNEMQISLFKQKDSIYSIESSELKNSLTKLKKAYSFKESETKDLNGIIINWEKIYNRNNTKKNIYKYGFWGAVAYIGIKVLLLK